jgi:hypothetical protein
VRVQDIAEVLLDALEHADPTPQPAADLQSGI